jgi:hypothetical protein
LSDPALNYYVAKGTAAQMGAFTPSHATPAAGPSPSALFYNTDDAILYAWDGAAWQPTNGAGTTAPKLKVRAATTANITIATALNNGDSLDGVTLATGDYVLVKDQTAAAENGVYQVDAVPFRPTDYDAYNEIAGSLLVVEEGTVNADTVWICTSNPGGTISVTAIVFAKIRHNPLAGFAFCQGRLTTESGVAVSTSDRTAQGTIYFTPYQGNQIGLYSGSAWALYAFAELSLALTLTSGKNYDVFVYDNAGTLTLELSAAWTNDTTRADALALQDGVYVKSGATTRRWLGTIRASAANVTEDSQAKRFVWNAYHRVARSMAVSEATSSWNYTTNTYRQANGAAANQLDYVVGLNEDLVTAFVRVGVQNNSGVNIAVGVGVDSTTVNSAQSYSGQNATSNAASAAATYQGQPGIGRHFLAWIESSAATGTTTWYSTAGSPAWKSGITGTVFN